MTGWELPNPEGTLSLEQSDQLASFLDLYPLAAHHSQQRTLAVIRRCAPGLNLPPREDGWEYQLFLFTPTSMARFPLPYGLEFKRLEWEQNLLLFETENGIVLASRAELGRLQFAEDPDSVFAGFTGAVPAAPAPITTTELESEVLGTMKPAEFEDWWEGRAVKVSLLGGVELGVTFTDLNPDADPGFLEEADRALQSFLAKTLEERSQISALVKENCDDFIAAVGIEDWNREMAQLTEPDDIWEFVRPRAIRIARRHRRDRSLYVQVECECDWGDELLSKL